MHIQRITFDRVFSVTKEAWKLRQWTEFGFTADGMTVHAARVVGHPPISAGDPLVMAMSSPGEWEHIYGWANLSTREVQVGGSLGDAVIATVMLLAFDLFIATIASWSWHSQTMLAALAVVPPALFLNTWIGSHILKMFRQVVARRALVRLMTSP